MMKEEKDEEERECFEMKQGVNKRELKCLQVDLRSRNVFNGKNERILSRR